MKAVLQNIKSGAITVGDIPQPVARPGTVLVRNVCSLVSAGTEKSVLDFSKANYLQKARQRPDLFRKVLNRAKNEGLWQTYQIVSNLINQPIQLGYSSAGIAMEVGAEVNDIQVGQSVACAGLFVATHSEVISVPRNLLVPIPEGASFEEASFVTLGAIALQGVRLADLGLAENVVVFGLGLVGMVTAQLALAAGCRVVGVDIDAGKVELARRFGCFGVVVSPDFEKTIVELTGGFGADKVLLCAATKSNAPVESVPLFTRQKGVVVVVGDVSMNIPRRAYYDKEIDLRISRSYGPGRYDLSYEEGGIDYPYAYVRWTENRNMEAVLDLVSRKRLDVGALITHRFSLADAGRAYDLIDGKVDERYLGIVIRYCEDDPKQAIERAVHYPRPAVRSGEIGIGVIGAGNFAKAFLLPAFARQPGVRFRAICTASGVSAAAVAAKYRAALATPDPLEVLKDPSVGLVVIATRHDSHARYVLDALRANKAVYVEKPLALTLDELDAIRSAYESAVRAGQSPYLMVGFNRRFSPLARALRQVYAARSGPISMIYRVNAGVVPATEWVHDARIGGGRVVGECCHFVDFMAYLCGSLPVSVSASPMLSGGKPSADNVVITMQMADGSLGTIHYLANGHSSMPKERIEVLGAGVGAELVNFRTLRVYGAPVHGRTRYLNQVKGFVEEAHDVIASLEECRAAPISFEELYSVSRATILAQHALVAERQMQV